MATKNKMKQEEVFNRYTPSRRVLTEKYDRKLAAERFFLGFLEDFEFGKNDSYPDLIFWMTKNGIPFMYLDKSVKNTRNLYVDYQLIWRVLESSFGMQYDEIQSFIQHLLSNTVKLEYITPTKKKAMVR